MDNFKIVYKILHTLDKAADYEEPDLSAITAEKLKISETRLNKIWRALIAKNYVMGVKYIETAGGEEVVFINPQLTLDGMEYLEENSKMQKAYKALKGIKDIVPGL